MRCCEDSDATKSQIMLIGVTLVYVLLTLLQEWPCCAIKLASEPFRQIERSLKHWSNNSPSLPKPILYVYDHCPFCNRVRLALGLKKVEYELRFLANDDVETPTKLVGKKIAPIFECPGARPIPESMDIIRLLDNDTKFGPTKMFKEASDRADLREWRQQVSDTNRIIQRPRVVLSNFPEFARVMARDAFVRNHPLPANIDGAKWCATDSSQRWKAYEQAYEDSFALIGECNRSLEQLESLLYSSDHCTEGGLSYDDVDLWSRLRLVTLVEGIEVPPKVKAYLQNLSERGDVPLLFSMAC